MKEHVNGIMPPEPPPGQLEENPVKLCHDIARLSRAKARETVIEGVMSQPGARLVLAFLAHNDGITQRMLVDKTHLKAPTVSVILRKMESEGMARLCKNPDDKRETRVYLTEYGREVENKGIAKIKETDSLALEGLDEAEYETLMRLLGRVRENLLESLAEGRRERRQ